MVDCKTHYEDNYIKIHVQTQHERKTWKTIQKATKQEERLKNAHPKDIVRVKGTSASSIQSRNGNAGAQNENAMQHIQR